MMYPQAFGYPPGTAVNPVCLSSSFFIANSLEQAFFPNYAQMMSAYGGYPMMQPAGDKHDERRERSDRSERSERSERSDRDRSDHRNRERHDRSINYLIVPCIISTEFLGSVTVNVTESIRAIEIASVIVNVTVKGTAHLQKRESTLHQDDSFYRSFNKRA